MPVTDTEPYLRLWQQKVLGLLLGRGKITGDLVDQMRRWTPPAWSVWPSTCCAARSVSPA
jgi:hypothetical protein